MTVIDPSDLTRYTSGYALVVLTPAEHALRRELEPYADSNVLNADAREHVVSSLRAARRDAARHLRGEYE